MRNTIRALAAALGVIATAWAPNASADPNALWTITHDQCVPNQERNGDPAPCALVDLPGRYVVVKDLVGATQFLLIPTDRVSGIESPEILAPDAPNYFAAAWRARTFVEQRAGQPIPRDQLSLAINSAADRTQDQLHIHVDCVRADVRDTLRRNISDIGPDWAPFPQPLVGQRYDAMVLAGEDITANPFQLLAGRAADMGAETLVAVGVQLTDGGPGFVLLANGVGPAHGEDLQDHDACPAAGT